jgi:hypothetical protein
MDYAYYKPCLDALKEAIGQNEERLEDFDIFEYELNRLYYEQRINGVDRNSDITRVIRNLNHLSRDVTGKSFKDLCDEVKTKPIKIIHLGDPANFDLEQLNRCKRFLLEPGLIGISVSVSSESCTFFPKYLKKRVKALLENLRRSERGVQELPDFSLRASLTPVDSLVEMVKQYKPILDTTDMLLTVITNDEERLARFWKKLDLAFSGPSQYCFLVLIIQEGDLRSPQGIKEQFSSPEFTEDHVIDWVSAVVDSLTNEGDKKIRLIRSWTGAIMYRCSQNNKLHTDWVYMHIENSLSYFIRNKSIDSLFKLFEEWQNSNAQTPP